LMGKTNAKWICISNIIYLSVYLLGNTINNHLKEC
jgi:hypothetical protein